MTDHGCHKLLHALHKNTTLHTLNMSGHFAVTKANEKSLVHLLKKNKTITHIDLNGTQIEEPSLADLSVMVTGNVVSKPDCRVLRLRRMDDVSFMQAMVKLQGNTSVHTLDLKHNKITNQAGGKLLEVMSNNVTVTSVDLMGCGLDKELLKMIKKRVDRNKNAMATALAAQQKKTDLKEAKAAEIEAKKK